MSPPAPDDPGAAYVAQLLRQDSQSRTSGKPRPPAGASARTIRRLLVKETRMTFLEWRNRRRLIAALEYLANGETVTHAAFAVGYDSPCRFIVAFRAMFVTPSRYFE